MYKEKARLERANQVEKRQLELTLGSVNGNDLELQEDTRKDPDLLLGRPEGFLTSPPGRRYNSIMIRRGDLSHGAAIRRAAEKANSYS
jgi:hypothetical protein